jgi:hypothetical protein
MLYVVLCCFIFHNVVMCRYFVVVSWYCKDIDTSEHRSQSELVSRCMASALYVCMRIQTS